ncbi:ABC transporter substrate-binding protein [Bradyrhizobium sp.]|uniref:ABC transporter substrate-binding protein n=1 Tax=Bradyrhizobium sp. TaxID=376 RepID=UPI003C2782CB
MQRRDFITLLGGATAAWPLFARAQQPMPVIGFLSTRSQGESASAVAAFHRGLSETGYVENRNVAVEYRWSDNQYDRLPALAADLVKRQVVVIATGGGPTSASVAKAATATIPVVFVSGEDPVKFGHVASLDRPGGNLKGISFLATALGAKRLNLIRKLLPAKTVAFLVNPNNPETEGQTLDLQVAASTVGQQIIVLKATRNGDLESAFANLVAQGANAVIVSSDPFLLSHRNKITEMAAHHRVAACYAWREAVMDGGLMSYGTNIPDAYRLAGIYTGRILKGAKPADLPVMQPTKFELVINLKTAKVLDLDVPATLLATADEVVE